MAEHNDLGKWGEQIAVDYLVKKGYSIGERNWRTGRLELDIIAYSGNRIVFVEVKTRTNDLVDPLTSIDQTRIRHLVNAARSYITRYNIPHEYQFDLVFVIGSPLCTQPPRIEHIPDAFLPPLQTYR